MSVFEAARLATVFASSALQVICNCSPVNPTACQSRSRVFPGNTQLGREWKRFVNFCLTAHVLLTRLIQVTIIMFLCACSCIFFYYEYRKLSVRGGGLWSFLHHHCTRQERSALGGLVEQRVLHCRDPRCAEGKRV